MEIGKLIKRNITIEPSMNMGFIVRIGCGCFVAADKIALLSGLSKYLSDPEKYEKRYGACGEVTNATPEEVAEVAGTIREARTRPEGQSMEATVPEAAPDSDALR